MTVYDRDPRRRRPMRSALGALGGCSLIAAAAAPGLATSQQTQAELSFVQRAPYVYVGDSLHDGAAMQGEVPCDYSLRSSLQRGIGTSSIRAVRVSARASLVDGSPNYVPSSQPVAFRVDYPGADNLVHVSINAGKEPIAVDNLVLSANGDTVTVSGEDVFDESGGTGEGTSLGSKTATVPNGNAWDGSIGFIDYDVSNSGGRFTLTVACDGNGTVDTMNRWVSRTQQVAGENYYSLATGSN